MIYTVESIKDRCLRTNRTWSALSRKSTKALIAWSRSVNMRRSKKVQVACEMRYRVLNARFTKLTGKLLADWKKHQQTLTSPFGG